MALDGGFGAHMLDRQTARLEQAGQLESHAYVRTLVADDRHQDLIVARRIDGGTQVEQLVVA